MHKKLEKYANMLYYILYIFMLKRCFMTRKESREQAFVLLFEYSFCGDTPEELFDIAEEAGVCVDGEFCKRAVETTIANVSEIDALISQFAKGWTVQRLSKVVLSALRLAICEIEFFDVIPDSVSINEAVELIKKYASEQDASFANGILGSISRS
jgi:N utilization substance protein B